MGWIPPQSAKYMSTQQINDELASFDDRLEELRRDLEESGGMSGSPGEGIYERIDELETELKRRGRSVPNGVRQSDG